VADRIQTEKAIAEFLEHMEEQVENVEVDAAMSVASSNVTQDPDVEPCSRLDPDMKYYGYNPTDEELLAQSLRIDQQIMDQLEELLRKAQEPKKTETREATICFQEMGRKSSIWPPDLWKMSTGDGFATGRWEIGVYRLVQCLGLLVGIPNKKLSGILNEGFWEICEFYAQLLAQLGGRWRMQLHPEQHYGLKALDTHASPEVANKAALLVDATASWTNWKEKMGKAKDEEIHATEAFTYADVASTRWNHLWNHRTKAPVRVLIMGSSLKFAHSTNGDKFKGLMLDKFGFEESEGNLIVEFFEDNFEDMKGAINDLMRILKSVKAQVADRESRTFICFTGRFFSRNTKFIPTPEDSFAF
jgi:hypothetical protein